MKMIAAMQARSGTVRGAPPRAWDGGGGSRLDALPQLIGQQAVGQGGHEPGSSHHPANPRFRNVLLGHIWGMNHRTTAVTNGLQRKANLPG
jgi:hypothetical protein